MLSKIARIALLMVLVSPLGWLAMQGSKAGAGGLKSQLNQDAPESGSNPLTYGASGYRYRILQLGDAIPSGFEQGDYLLDTG